MGSFRSSGAAVACTTVHIMTTMEALRIVHMLYWTLRVVSVAVVWSIQAPAPAPVAAPGDPCDVHADKTTCLTVEGCSWKQEEAFCIEAPLTATCQQWDGKRRRCKNEGCKWRSGTSKCKGYWG